MICMAENTVRPRMVYLCTGMYRSGTTWLYNAVRVILREAGARDIGAGWFDEKDELLEDEIVVIKIHRFHAELAEMANIVLKSHRDLRYISASIFRKFKEVPNIETIRRAFEGYSKWAKMAAYDM